MTALFVFLVIPIVCLYVALNVGVIKLLLLCTRSAGHLFGRRRPVN